MPVDDDLAAVVAANVEHALIERRVVHAGCVIQCVDDPLKQLVGERAELRGAPRVGRGVG